MRDLAKLIAERLPLTPVPGLPQIRLHTAAPSSRLSELLGDDGDAPYWAYPWSGGAVLARYILEHLQIVRGKHVLDLGAGGGIVSIAAGLAGATSIVASERDPTARDALRLNLAANGVTAAIVDDVTAGATPRVDIVLGGDVFYAPEVAMQVLPFLDRCLASGIDVLVGDPGRRDLPLARLERIATYPVAEVGAPRGSVTTNAAVYRLLQDRE